MNTNRLILFLLPFLIFARFMAFADENEPGKEVVNLIKDGNSRELARHFNNTVQLTLPGNEGRFSRTQAELIVREFFNRYPPKTFIISHQGSSADGSLYFIGVYSSGNVAFRTYYLIKTVNDKSLIHQFRFEKE